MDSARGERSLLWVLCNTYWLTSALSYEFNLWLFFNRKVDAKGAKKIAKELTGNV